MLSTIKSWRANIQHMLVCWCIFLLPSPCCSQSLLTTEHLSSMTSSSKIPTETLTPVPSKLTMPLPLTATPAISLSLPSFSMRTLVSSSSRSTSTESQTLISVETVIDNDITTSISTTLLPSSVFTSMSQLPISVSSNRIQTTILTSPTVNTSGRLQLLTIMTSSLARSVSLSSQILPSQTSPVMNSIVSITPSISRSPLDSGVVSLPSASPSPPLQSISELDSTVSTPIPLSLSMRVVATSAINMNTNNSSNIPASMMPTPTQIEKPTVDVVGTGMKTEVVVGIIIGITLFTAILLVVVSLSCYICCRTKKYEYNTGNEYRVTVQHWKANSDHYTANRSESASLSSSRGSSFMSSFGLKPKVRPRHGSSPADRVTTVVNPEFFYSTPL